MKRSIAVFFAFVACVCFAGKIKIEGGKKVTKAGVISVSADWVKDKGKKYDINLSLTNESKQSIIVMLNDLHCKRGNATGIIHHTFFNTGERTIDLTPGQVKSFNMVCDVKEPTRGDYQVSIGRVFENPANDGKTKGKVLATDVVWELSQLKAK